MLTITLELNEDEQAALEELARQEISGVSQTAMNAVRRELQRRGLLKAVETVTEAGTRKVYKVIED